MNDRRQLLVSVSAAIGALAGLLSILCVVWYGGALAERIRDHDRRIGTLETGGSIPLQRHESKDDTRVLEFGRRMDAQEAAIADLVKIKTDVAALNAKVDVLLGTRK